MPYSVPFGSGHGFSSAFNGCFLLFLCCDWSGVQYSAFTRDSQSAPPVESQMVVLKEESVSNEDTQVTTFKEIERNLCVLCSRLSYS